MPDNQTPRTPEQQAAYERAFDGLADFMAFWIRRAEELELQRQARAALAADTKQQRA